MLLPRTALLPCPLSLPLLSVFSWFLRLRVKMLTRLCFLLGRQSALPRVYDSAHSRSQKGQKVGSTVGANKVKVHELAKQLLSH